MDIKSSLAKFAKDKFIKTVAGPINEIVDQNITDISTTIGSFILRSVRGKFQRSITFNIGINYADNWMEEALYGILYKYNNIKASSRLNMKNEAGSKDGSSMYCKLDDGVHNLKYRNYNILLAIQTKSPQSASGRIMPVTEYTVITYDLNPDFVVQFEKDMINHRNSLLKIKKDSPTVNVYQDYHEGDGYTYWEKMGSINKRRIGTIYLPEETKRQLVTAINEFFRSKDYYIKHGVAHNLKILLYGPPGPQPISTIIPTPNGNMMLRDIRPGDEVYARDGSITKVEGCIGYDEPAPVYEVNFSNGTKVHCDIEHKFNVYIGDDSSSSELTVDNIADNLLNNLSMHIKLPQYSCECKYNSIHHESYILSNTGKEIIPIIDPWVIGFLLKNCYYGLEKIFINIDKSTDPLDSFSLFNIIKIFNDNHVNISKYDFLDTHVFDNTISYVFKNIITRDGIIVTSENFYTLISSFLDNIEIAPIGIRYSFINGIMDNNAIFEYNEDEKDGYVKLPTTRVRNKNDIHVYLRDKIISVLRSLGYYVELCHNDDGWGDYLKIGAYNSGKLSRLFRYNEYMKSSIIESDISDKYNKIYIKSVIRLDYCEPMKCLNIEHESHEYLTENYIPTCNSGKDSIAKMIASEWNRNLYYVNGGKDGKFIPNAIACNSDEINYPLLLISDIDKYPYLINEPDVDMDKQDGSKEEAIKQKQLFGNMINALDGILSGEDKIIVMTTNHIEKFSETFLRPGRVDLKLYIGYINPEIFRKFVYDMYHVKLPNDIKLKDDKLTISTLQRDVMFLKLTFEEFCNKYVK